MLKNGLNNRRVFGGGSNWMSRKKKRSTPPPPPPPYHQKEIFTAVTAVSVTPKTYFSEDGTESNIILSIQTQSSQEQSASGFTPVAKKRRNTFGSRKAPHVYDSMSDDFFYSPSILCRKNSVSMESQEKRTDEGNRTKSASPLDSADKSSLSTRSRSESLDGPFLFEVKHEALEMNDPPVFTDSVNESIISQGSSITGVNESEHQTMITKDPSHSQNNAFDFDDTTTIHSTTPTRRVKQPSSTMTSLDKARAYFAQLDSSPLLIEAVDDREPRRNIVRTRRRLLPTHPTVIKEYKDYENACACAQVPAMSLEEFSRNRKNFQADDVLYEGFLDADD